MATVPFSQLHDQIVPYLPGAEVGIINSQLRKVLRDFMKRTTLFRESFSFNVVPGVDTYRLTPTFGQVSSVIAVYRAGSRTPLPVVPEEYRYPRDAATATGWFTTIPELLSVYPTPISAEALAVVAAITLKQDDVTLPSGIYTHHAEAIAAGVLAMMMSMPGKPWTQSKAALDSGRIYAGHVRTIRASLRDGGQPNASTIRGIARFGA